MPIQTGLTISSKLVVEFGVSISHSFNKYIIMKRKDEEEETPTLSLLQQRET